jgi:subtilisin family serine protease
VLGGPAGASAADPDPVEVALSRPALLDEPSEVRALADATTGRAGTRVGVVLDRNGARPGGIAVEVVVADSDDLDLLVHRLAGVPTVVVAAVDQPVRLATGDPLTAQQWGPTRVGSPALPPDLDGRGTTVAVLDTGVEATHPDLTPLLPDGRSRVAPGTSFLSGQPANGLPGTTDPHGHGTHVAGIIAAARGNGVGGAGVAPGARILPVRVLSATGTGWSSDVAAGILWAHQQGADVINLSLGGPGVTPPAVGAAIGQVTTDATRGKPPTVVVAASGNNGWTGTLTWPANHPRVIAVGATTSADGVASFSNRAPSLSLTAPGVGILSTCRGGGFCTMSGTSMAAPMVAAAAAVLRQQAPTRGPDQIRAALEAHAVDLGTPGRDPDFGAGRLDLAAAASAPLPPPPTAPVMLAGTVDRVAATRRRWELGGAVTDPDGPPVVQVLDTVAGSTTVMPAATTGGRWSAERHAAPPGTHTLCAVGVDQPTGQGVLLGCRQVVVK